MVKAHFFDIDNLIRLDNKAWIVDKNNPNVPIMKISKSDFNLIESGIFRKQNHKMEFNGKTFWLPTELVNKIKVKAKNAKADFSNLALSLQEFLNKDILNEMDFEIDLDVISNLKNKVEDIYIICSRQTRHNYEKMIEKLESQLKEEGILIKNFYYISESFYNYSKDEVKFKKERLLLQHLVGYKTEGNKFIDDEISRYDEVYFYDNSFDTLKVIDDINPLFQMVLQNTDRGLSDVIKEDVVEYKPYLIVTKVNSNTYNKMETKRVLLSPDILIKTFESFRKFN